MRWQMENPKKREEKALVFAPNTLSLGCLFVYLEAEMSLRPERPTSSDAKLMGGG